MKYILENEGKGYRRFFEDICSIPHVSYKEKALSDYIVEFAKARGLWYHQDEVWNVIIKKPASPGYEDHEPIMIQGHIDMVGVKLPDSNHNFHRDPLPIYVEDGFIRSRGTTLGADCGHGVSYILSILDDNSLKHPPIEALLTVQEEVGIRGPKHLDYSLLNAKRMIFTDSMEEGKTEMSTTSVLGGDFTKPLAFAEVKGRGYRLRVGGLLGGHGAVNINQGRGNAISLAARAMLGLMDASKIEIASFDGGDLKNNIPKEAEVCFCADLEMEAVKCLVKEIDDTFKFEFRQHDPEIFISAEECEITRILSYEDSKKLVEWIFMMPSGTQAIAFDDPSFPWSSCLLGTIATEANEVVIGYQYRSNMGSHIEMMKRRMDTLSELYGASWQEQFGYPGYVAKPHTPLYDTYDEVLKEMRGKGIEEKHIHAGTDVGTLIEGMGGDMDVIGIGPNTYKFHTPFEEMELASYDRAYTYIVKLLEKL